jgi:hypothetical protein
MYLPVVLFGVRCKDFDAGKSITRAIRRGRPWKARLFLAKWHSLRLLPDSISIETHGSYCLCPTISIGAQCYYCLALQYIHWNTWLLLSLPDNISKEHMVTIVFARQYLYRNTWLPWLPLFFARQYLQMNTWLLLSLFDNISIGVHGYYCLCPTISL